MHSQRIVVFQHKRRGSKDDYARISEGKRQRPLSTQFIGGGAGREIPVSRQGLHPPQSGSCPDLWHKEHPISTEDRVSESIQVARPEGLEPTTFGSAGQRSIH